MGRDSLMSPGDNRRMFDAIARRYDRANRWLSLGLDRGWRRRAIEALAPRPGGRYLDIGCGTGDVALGILRRCHEANVVGLDPALGMLRIAVEKSADARVAATVPVAGPVDKRDACRYRAPALVAGDATALPFAHGSFDGVISAFCIRNVADRAAAFAEMRRVLVAGGRVVTLELTRPTNPLLRLGHWLYNRTVVPVVGRLLTRAGQPYRYLVNSIQAFPRAEELLSTMARAGLRHTRHHSLTGGTATVFVGER